MLAGPHIRPLQAIGHLEIAEGEGVEGSFEPDPEQCRLEWQCGSDDWFEATYIYICHMIWMFCGENPTKKTCRFELNFQNKI